MSEENIYKTEETEKNEESRKFNGTEEKSALENEHKRFFSRRNSKIAPGIKFLFIVGLAFLFMTACQSGNGERAGGGFIDNYIERQFVEKMSAIGITFEAEVFDVSIRPLNLYLKNATFVNKTTGEKLFSINEARLDLSIQNLYAWQLSRDIKVENTVINGAEVWVTFDEGGKSNFSALEFVEEEPGYVNFNYTSTNFSLVNGLIHFDEEQRKINADARNIEFFIQPYNRESSDEEKRYLFEFTSTESVVKYQDSEIQPVGIYAQGIAGPTGADITLLKLDSPIGNSVLQGQINDWEQIKYQFQIESNVDLTQTSSVLPLGTPLRGIGSFQGTVTGIGDEYRIEGEITSEALAAPNIYLKNLNLNATLEGKDSMYEANGKAIAELLTFEDFRIEFPQIIGNIRGTGTDFRWVGELQAAAAKSPLGTIGGLFITDAVAEYQDEKLTAELGNVRARNFNSDAADAQGLRAGNVKIIYNGNRTYVLAPTVNADKVTAENATLQNVTARNVEVVNDDGTTAKINALRAGRVTTEDARLQNVTAQDVRIRSNGTTRIEARRVQADDVDVTDANVGALTATNVNVQIDDNRTRVYSDNVRVARLATDSAIIGSLNIAGVRLTMREGRIEGASNDINLGDVKLTNAAIEGGGRLENVRLGQPVFVLEPSGRYRASADMSLGGGVLGSINLGAARANVTATNRQIELDNLTADLMDGRVTGEATIALEKGVRSNINADFANLDLGKILALQGGKVVPIEGETTGRVNLSFPGTNFEKATGEITADINAQAGKTGQIPVAGRVELTANQGLFNVNAANLRTNDSRLNASGQFDLSGNQTNLDVALDSTDAGEIQRLINILELFPEVEEQLNQSQVELAGNLNFRGNITGNLSNPAIDGRAELESVKVRGSDLGSLASNISVTPGGDIFLRDGILRERDGGTLAFNVTVPSTGANNIALEAKLDKFSLGKLLSAAPIELPPTLRGLQAETSGTVNLTGLPGQIQGDANFSATQGEIDGQTFDKLDTRLTFAGNQINIEQFDARFGDGSVRANGTYNTETGAVNLEVNAQNVQIKRLKPFIPDNQNLPDLQGEVNLTARINGFADQPSTYNVNFSGVGRDITLNGRALGQIEFTGTTENQQLQTRVTATINGQQQNINANVNFADENLPFRAETVFQDTNLAPYLNLAPLPANVPVSGRATGRVILEGNLRGINEKGEREFSTEGLRGAAEFTQLSLQIEDTPLVATEPVSVRFTTNEITIENAKFAGGGTNVTVSGTYALNKQGTNNLAIDGSINLRVLNALSANAFFSGIANVEMRLTGSGGNPRLIGVANLDNATFSVFVGNERLTLQRVDSRILFTTNQAQIQSFTGFLGGGKVTASGGALLDGLELQAFRLNIQGSAITAPLPEDFITTGDVQAEITGRRGDNGLLTTFVSGTFNARRALYTKNIDLADVIGGRRESSISQGGGGGGSILGDTRLDIRIVGRDALVVRNNLADLTASIDMRVAGNIDEPQYAGRITANSGTLLFRDNRYEVLRGVLEFPPNTTFEPYINLLAETDIQGYQILVTLAGNLTETETLNASVRSVPALPQADVISLITTGNLSNTDTGIPTLAQGGLNTVAEILTDEIINKPIAKATDKLFGLNRFELDPIISGTQRGNPTARLTVGRQINRNLLITYSTNLSQEQNQVLALEYRVSNRLSVVAQYEQRALSNVTQKSSVFSFEVRLRKRF